MKKSMLTQSETSDSGSTASESAVCIQRIFSDVRHFSKTNEFLIQNGLEPIDWQIENKEQQEVREYRNLYEPEEQP